MLEVLTNITLSELPSLPLAANMALILAAAAAAAPVGVVSVLSVLIMSHFERRFFTGGPEMSLLEEQ